MRTNKNVRVKPRTNHAGRHRRGQLRESEFVKSLRKMIRERRLFAFKVAGPMAVLLIFTCGYVGAIRLTRFDTSAEASRPTSSPMTGIIV